MAESRTLKILIVIAATTWAVVLTGAGLAQTLSAADREPPSHAAPADLARR